MSSSAISSSHVSTLFTFRINSAQIWEIPLHNPLEQMRLHWCKQIEGDDTRLRDLFGCSEGRFLVLGYFELTNCLESFWFLLAVKIHANFCQNRLGSWFSFVASTKMICHVLCILLFIKTILEENVALDRKYSSSWIRTNIIAIDKRNSSSQSNPSTSDLTEFIHQWKS